MHATVAVQDLKIGMFVRLELGWMSHPFPLSSFRISSAEQIATLRALGLQQVIWIPEKSDPAEASQAASPAAEPVVADEVAAGAERRRAVLRAQREAQARCEAQYGEADQTLREIGALLNPDPHGAARQAEALAGAMVSKMLDAGQTCIRLLGINAADRSAAHALNVAVISLLMARSLQMPEPDLRSIGIGALLHDIGKLDLPFRAHHMEDGFRTAELEAYRDHVTLGVARGRRMGLGSGVLQVLAQHHEMADGSGFPGRMNLEAMSPGARVVALVNRYDNLCNPGPHAIALTPHEALSTLFAQSRSKFDVAILGGFIHMMGVYPAGSLVQLTDDRYAMVVQVNSSRPLKPRVLVHEPGVPRDEALLLDLECQRDLGIRRSLPLAKLPSAAASYLAPRPRVAYYFDSLHPLERSDELLEAA